MKNLSGLLAVLAIFLCVSISYGQSNILSPNPWTEGTGNDIAGYLNMRDNESLLEKGTDPFGNPESVLWKCIPNPAGDYLDGGFSALATETLNINNPYQISMWVKQNGSSIGTAKVDILCSDSNGIGATVRLDGSSNQNRIIHSGPLPIQDTWLFVVSYIYPSTYAGAYNKGGIYNPAGDKLATTGEFKFTTTPNPTLNVRAMYYGAPSAIESVYYFDPRVYEVNDQTPSINQLMGLSDPNTGGNSPWVINSNGVDINYSSGNVGIGVENPDAPLTVKGKIHANEVKVDVEAPIVPDYVFKKDYDLRSLYELNAFIEKNGHLPNIPSALEMAKDGMGLKTMNLKLLEKIEELTLYIINQENRITELEQKNEQTAFRED